VPGKIASLFVREIGYSDFLYTKNDFKNLDSGNDLCWRYNNLMSEKRKAKYNHSLVETHWQTKWEKDKIFYPDLKTSKKPYYNLMMFPYPSAEGMHVGNMYAFTGADVHGRFMRMKGLDVFEPIGLDGFGIHSENYALSINEHPVNVAKRTEKNFYAQLKAVGNSYAWPNTLETYDPEYYKWTQWIFTQMFKAGLAYRAKSTVNWCPSCKTVLADEQVIASKCERCSKEVKTKDLEQWFFRTATGKRPNGELYADLLLKNLDKINWSKKITVAQRNWIGKKEGIDIAYPIKNTNKTLTCFTTRPDTNFGATFIVLSPETANKFLDIMPTKQRDKVSKYIKEALSKSKQERREEGRKKTGIFSGLNAINQLNKCEMPIWVSDFVLAEVGTGTVVGVPGHDKRDFEFAKEFNLPIIRVVVGSDGDKSSIERIEQVQEGGGKMINSEFIDGMGVDNAIEKIMDHLKKKDWGKRKTSYHLRDWLISRQRYWGPPIPMIYCEKCADKGKGEKSEMPGWHTVNEKDLPVELPFVKDYQPKGTGASPLAASKDFYEVKCPACGEKAKRETDVSDTFLDSSWYFFRYPSIGTKSSGEKIFDPEITKKWLPVSMYIGGAEHSVLHLLYSRWITMVFKDLGLIDFEEPYGRFYAHGMIIKDGAKMSKSRGNIVVPDEYIKKFGADAFRTYLMFLGPYDAGGDFRDTGIEGMRRFIERAWDLFENHKDFVLVEKKDCKEVRVKMHQTIKKVTKDVENLRYNTAISAIMEFVNLLRDKVSGEVKEARGENRCEEWNEALKTLALLLAPFAPHITEEAWVKKLGQEFSIHTSAWPKFNSSLVKETKSTVVLQVDGKLRATILASLDEARNKEEMIEKANKDKNIQKWIKGKTVKNTIFVPGKLINFVTG
jgi:leucyl-tRNA synthetase